MLIELRSTGCQTIAPPSLHPSGETVRWERDGEPGVVSGERLRRAVAKVATVALLARHWPGVGERDEAAKDLAGLLLRGGWAADEVDDFTRLVATIAGDEEWRRRGKARGTARKLAEGAHVTGGTTLASRLGGDGERVVAQARTWLGLSGLGSAHVPASAIDGHPSAIDGHSQETTIYGADGHLWRRWSVTASALERTQVSWLWHGRIPLGAITMLDGDPGLGKSLITLDLAARVTTGRGMPLGAPAVEGAERGAGVVLLSAEDHLTATILPRLVMAAADMDRVKILRGAMADSPEAGRTLERQFLLPRDLPLLEEDIQEVEARLVVIDPLMAFLDGTVNSWRDQDVRAVLAPLAALAERTGAAILILRHLNKASGMSAIQRGGGSIGIIAAARSGLLVAKHPDNPDQERVLASTKSNLGPTMPALRYRLATPVKRTEELEDLWDVPAVDWLGECDFNATALLAASPATEAGATAKKEAAAMDWLREELADGARPASDLTREALAAGIAAQTFQRATTRLGVVKKKVGFGGSGHWVWRLPAAAETPLETPPETRETPLMAKTAIDGHSEKVTIYGNDDHLWKQWKATPRCPVTGGPHEYTQFRHADGRLRCVECGEARDEDGGDEGQEDEQGQGAWE
jgi:hypothetical protein